MLNSLLSILSGLFSIFGWFKSNKDIEAGKDLQKLSEAQSTIKEGETANAITEKDMRLSDADIDAGLREYRDN